MRENIMSLVGPVMAAFLLTAVGGPIVIPFLRRLKCGQTVRDDGPATHLKKGGTPTMGGILIVFAAVAVSLYYLESYPEIMPVLFMTVGFGLIGFIDDYIKVVCRRSMGLRAWQKLALQLIVTGIFAYYMLYYTDLPLAMEVPGVSGLWLDFGRWNIFVLFFIVLGTVNGINLTDGLDGLAGSVTVMVAVFFTVVAVGIGSGIAPITCAVAGALLGFLLFNAHPAAVFMGDTGSLALGGFVAACGYLLQMPLYIAIVGIVYLVETGSVILQVLYFKLSGGKRLFRMAPLHHHFELCGWSETAIVTLFTIVTALMCLLALLL
ncbi:MAG: phospho-N-acetylmuramoyl-pentapeptide-transferase [Butyrivibrio sp.]|nr:phospho-N-acetylmuramoyl-pentapeptide-transferase [Muribaculum sp.]MCM1551414.1 phospho-N-acetylmuramoyl-pentapeptide-transferase [Butyrivibrio sp.]